MKILLVSVGTRGDIEPFLAIGGILRAAGYEVSFSFPEQFRSLVGNGAKFYALSAKFQELIESPEGKAVMGKAPVLTKIRALFRLYWRGLDVNKKLVIDQQKAILHENPAVILFNSKCSYPLIWSLKTARPCILLSPVPYFMYQVEGHPHVGFNFRLPSFLTNLTYKLANFGLVKSIADAQQYTREARKFSRKEIRAHLFKRPVLFTISPSLFQQPASWPRQVSVIGYPNSQAVNNNFSPGPAAEDFFNRHENVLFLTFGSMVNASPVVNSILIYRSLATLGIPTVVNTAAGGLEKMAPYDNSPGFLFVSEIPYAWVLERSVFAIHHGGSGTTHLSLKHGCATMIIPHILDQFAWNEAVAHLGAGPRGVGINKISEKNIRGLIHRLCTNLSYQHAAAEIAKTMQKENFQNQLLEVVKTEVAYITPYS